LNFLNYMYDYLYFSGNTEHIYLWECHVRCLPNNVRYDNLVCYNFRIKTMFCLSLPPVVCRRAHVLFTLFAYSGVQHILCCVFLCLLYPMMPVSLDCPFLIVLRYYLMFIRYIKWDSLFQNKKETYSNYL
jgi:hypothetical protein